MITMLHETATISLTNTQSGFLYLLGFSLIGILVGLLWILVALNAFLNLSGHDNPRYREKSHSLPRGPTLSSDLELRTGNDLTQGVDHEKSCSSPLLPFG